MPRASAALKRIFAAVLCLSLAVHRSWASESPTARLVRHAIRSGRGYEAQYQLFRFSWQEHLERNHAMILEGANRVIDKRSATLIGVNDGKDAPVRELADQFGALNLVDIDAKSLQRAVESVPSNAVDAQGRPLRRKMHRHVLDITCGGMTYILEHATQAIKRAAPGPEGAIDALQTICLLYESSALPAMHDALKPLQASYVISSNVGSQIVPRIDAPIRESFGEKFQNGAGKPMDIGIVERYQTARDVLLKRVLSQHAGSLAHLVQDGGRVYWADTVAETPMTNNLNHVGKLMYIIRLVDAIKSWGWTDLLNEAGKAAVAKRLLQSGLLRCCSMSAVGQMLAAFEGGRLGLEEKYAVLYGITMAIRDSFMPDNSAGPFIPNEKAIALARLMVAIAEPISPSVQGDMIPGGMARLFEGLLGPDGDTARWLWLHDLRGPMVGTGGVYHVEAHILKKPGPKS